MQSIMLWSVLPRSYVNQGEAAAVGVLAYLIVIRPGKDNRVAPWAVVLLKKTQGGEGQASQLD